MRMLARCLLGGPVCQRLRPWTLTASSSSSMPKRRVKTTASRETSDELPAPLQNEESGVGAEAEEPEDKPKPKKKRKPTQKQIEEAEAAARPRYDESGRPPRFLGPALRIVTWNVASLKSTLARDPDAISRLAEHEGADVVCLQETKLQSKAVADVEPQLGLAGWHHHWSCSEEKKGYSGTATLTRREALSVSLGMGGATEHDAEGRVITTEFDACYVVNVYTPNSGEGLRRLEYRVGAWDRAFAEYIAGLQARKPVVVTGDLNCAHRDIDIHSPRTNKKSAGFTEEERESFQKNLEDLGLIDCFRNQYPDTVGYTYWSIRSGARAKNKGWRLDYFLASEKLRERLYDCSILKSYQERESLSDHCPIGLVLKL